MPRFVAMHDDVYFAEHQGKHGTVHRGSCPDLPADVTPWARGVAFYRRWSPESHRGPFCWPMLEVELGGDYDRPTG